MNLDLKNYFEVNNQLYSKLLEIKFFKSHFD